MKTKIVYLLMALALVFGLLAAVATPAGAVTFTWYVSVDGSNTNSGTGPEPENAWRDIQYAVDNASGGDTILVAAGTYNEDVTVDKNLTLNGAQAGVDARGRSASESEIVGSIKVTSDATSVTIDGFKITGTELGAMKGVCLRTESASVTVKNNIVVAVDGSGYDYSGIVDIDDVTNAVVEYNDFSGVYDAPREPNVIRLGITGGGTVTVVHNDMHDVGGGGGVGIMSGNASAVITIEDNEFDNTGDGVWVWNIGGSIFDTLSITDNYIHNSQKTGVKTVSPVTGDMSVSGNTFENNNMQVDDGAEVLDIQQVLDNNTFDKAVVVDHPGGSLLHVIHSSIQAAVGDAVSGDTVIVHPGKYQDNVYINDMTLTLRSTTLDWRDVDLDPNGNHGITIYGAGHVTVQGFEIHGFGQDGIHITNIRHGGSVTILDCFIHDNSSGIFGGRLNGLLTIDGNIIGNNTGGNTGVALMNVGGPATGGTVEITDNDIRFNAGDGIKMEHIHWMSTVTIGGLEEGKGNDIGNNTGDGIDVEYVDGSLNILGNNGSIHGNNGDGIDIYRTRPGSSVVIQGNDISDSVYAEGIHIKYLDGLVTIQGNTIVQNPSHGIQIDYVDGTLLIDDNKIAENGVDGSDGIYIKKIRTWFAQNPATDRWVRLVGDVTISNNDIGAWDETYGGNEDAGIYIDRVSSGCTLMIGGDENGNTIVDNGFAGIYLDDASSGADVTIEGNEIAYNGESPLSGIYLEDSKDVTVDGNDISEHAYGIYLEDSSYNALINNTITENDTGIYLDDDSDHNGIVGNLIADNGDGIYVEGDDNDILRNVITRNVGAALSGPQCGVYIDSFHNDADGNVVNYNNITENDDMPVGNSYGVFHRQQAGEDAEILDARWNWWGDANGPYHGGTNPDTTGDSVSSFVDYSGYVGEAYDYTTDASMPWDTEGPEISEAVITPDMLSLYSALSDMWLSTWTADTPFSPGPSEGRYGVTTSDVDPGAPPRGVRYVNIDIKSFLEQLLGGTSLENIEGIPSLFIKLVEAKGQMTLYGHDLCADGTIWTTSGSLPWTVTELIWFMGEEEFFATVRPGEIKVPVTAIDWSGNPTETFIDVAIVDEALALRKGWNLRSTPITLALNSWKDIAALGDGLEHEIALMWNAELERWEQLTDDGLMYDGQIVGDAIVRPLDGIAIKCGGFDSLGLVFDREGQPAAPAMPVYEGWNMIGLAVSPPQDPFMPVDDALISIEEIRDGTRGYIIVDSSMQYVEVNKEYELGDGECRDSVEYDWYFGQTDWQFLHHGAEAVPPIPNMTIGGAYWVFMERDDILAGFSSTPFLSLTLEQHEDLDSVPRYPATTMTMYRDWLTVMSSRFWEHWVPEGWQGLQWAEIKYKGEFTLDGFYSFYEEQMPLYGWQFSHKLVVDGRGDEQEGRMVFWKHLPYDPAGEPPYTFIAHFSVDINSGPDNIEVIYLPIDVPTAPGLNLAAWHSAPLDRDRPLSLEFEGSGTINSAAEFYVEAMAKLGWKLDEGNSGVQQVCLYEKYGHCWKWGEASYVLSFHKPSVGGGIPPTPLYCQITIRKIDIDSADMIEVEVERGTGFAPRID